MDVIDRKMTLLEAFKVVDSVFGQGVGGIADIITTAGLVNVDFADVKTIMKDAGWRFLELEPELGKIEPRWRHGQRFLHLFLIFRLKVHEEFFSILQVEMILTMFEVDEAARIISSQQILMPTLSLVQ